MQSTGDIYMDALKFGITKMQSGISFKELITHLTNCMGWKFEDEYLKYFRLWFHTNFYNDQVYPYMKSGNATEAGNIIRNLHGYDAYKCVINSDAYETYLDYQKLQQARKDAKKAHDLALWAIWISVAFGVLQIGISWYNKN